MRRVLIGILFVFFISHAFSQTTKYNIRYFDHVSGLTSINIRKIVQDPYGFMWVATQDGLFRHDSRGFEQYNKSYREKRSLGGTDVRNLLVDSVNKRLWLSSSYGGIDVIDLTTGTTVKHFSQEKYPALANNLIKSFLLIDNTVFLGCERGLYALDLHTDALRLIDIPGCPAREAYITLVTEVEKGRLLILFRNMRSFLYDVKRNSIVEKQWKGLRELQSAEFFSYSRNSKGEICIVHSGGVGFFKWENAGLVHKLLHPLSAKPGQWAEATVRRAVYDRTDKLWLATTGGLLEYDGREVRKVLSNDQNHPGSYWLHAIYSMYVDNRNNLWLGCQSGVAYLQNSPAPFVSYSYSETSRTPIRHAYYLYPANDTLLFSAAQEGLYAVNRKTYAIVPVDQGLTYDFIFTDPYDRLIVSNARGLYILEQQRKIPIDAVYGEFKPFAGDRINSSIQINDSCLAMGTENDKGILIWNFIEHKLYHFHSRSEKVHLFDNTVNNLYCLAKNRFLILSDASLSLFDLSTLQVKDIPLYRQKSQERLNIFFDVCRVRDTFFLACYGQGVMKLDKELKLIGEITTASGLSNNGVYKILPWRDSLLIITTNNGLNVYNLDTWQIQQFYKENGLQDNVFEETSGNVYKDEVFVGGPNGFTAVWPGRIVANREPPALFVNSILTEQPNNLRHDTANLLLKELAIPNDVLQTYVFFSGISYLNPGRTAFQYRIRELDSNWINLGTKNFISLVAVKPHTYHLEVKAGNEDGVWSSPVELTLIFLPKWYQTWWFRTIVALLVMGMLYGLYRYRLAQLKKEQQIRQRIAGDLHDDIGSTLNSIKVFTNLAMMKPENNLTYLQQLKEGVQSAIVGVRDMVWVLDDKQDTLGHLLSRIEQFIHPLASAQGISFESYLDPTLADRMLKKEEKRNLYLILKEALNNSIKYAEASVLQLRIEKSAHDRYMILVQDDGKGFDINTVQKGNGLHNLQYRAQQIRYDIEVRTAPAQGTAIVLTRP